MPPHPPRAIVRLSLLVYGPMIASGVFVKPPGAFRVASLEALALGLGAAVALTAGTIWFSQVVSRRTAWGRRLRAEFGAVLGGLHSRHMLWLALLSGFGEEVLFRGVLQPRLGLLVATLLFGLLHFPFRRSLWPWTLFALAMGAVLGDLTAWSGTLWPAILLHFLVNYFNLHDLVQRPPARAGDGAGSGPGSGAGPPHDPARGAPSGRGAAPPSGAPGEQAPPERPRDEM